MIRNILIVVVVVVAGVLGYIASRPSDMHIERSTRIQAPIELTFGLVNDLRAWEAWSPWERLDPDMEKTYSGPQAGQGAAYAWSGNDDVGKGSMEIVDSVQNEKVAIDLRFKEPFEDQALTTFTFEPDGDDATRVTWTMTGEYGFVEKAMTLFLDFDAMIGKDFEKGFSHLKEVAAEKLAEREKAAQEAEAEAMAKQAEAEAEDAENTDSAPRATGRRSEQHGQAF